MQPAPYAPSRPHRRAGAKRQAILAGIVLLVVFLTPLRGLLDSGWGWIAIGATVLLWNLLAAYRPRQWPRVLAAGAVASVLAFAVTAAAAGPTTPPAAPRKPSAQTETAVNVQELRGAALDLWQRMASGFSKYSRMVQEQQRSR
jgi:hypothetical protein